MCKDLKMATNRATKSGFAAEAQRKVSIIIQKYYILACNTNSFFCFAFEFF